MGFTIKDIRELFEAYDKGGRDAQLARALPMFRRGSPPSRSSVRKSSEALETLIGASERLMMKLEATERPA